MKFGSIISIQEQNRIPWFGKYLSSPPSKTFKFQPSARGWWLVLFRYKRDPPSTRKLALRWVNASKYCDTFNKVKDTVPHKRQGLLNEGVISQGNMTTPLGTLDLVTCKETTLFSGYTCPLNSQRTSTAIPYLHAFWATLWVFWARYMQRSRISMLFTGPLHPRWNLTTQKDRIVKKKKKIYIYIYILLHDL